MSWESRLRINDIKTYDNSVRVGVIKNEQFDGIGTIIPDNLRQP